MSKEKKYLKLNRVDVVKTQMNPNWGEVKLPTELEVKGAKDEDCYVVAIIDRLHDSIAETYDTVVRTIKYRVEAYVKMKDHFQRAGLKNMFILHDPTIVEEKVETILDLKIGDAVEAIKAIESIEELESFVGDDTRKGVLDAKAKRVEELKG